jgi:hypothetical protein
MSNAPDNHDVLILDESHRASCAECAALWHELEMIGADAAKLPPLVPERDLWSGIEARIGAATSARPSTPFITPSRTAVAAKSWSVRPAFRTAVAASLLMAATSAVTWQIARSNGGAEMGTPSAPGVDIAANVDSETADDLHLASFQSSVRSMEDEIATLERIVATRRAELDPRTVRVLEQNLQLIDRAIAESREALTADPASAFLSAQYARAYNSKITLLRDVATLPTGI